MHKLTLFSLFKIISEYVIEKFIPLVEHNFLQKVQTWIELQKHEDVSQSFYKFCVVFLFIA